MATKLRIPVLNYSLCLIVLFLCSCAGSPSPNIISVWESPKKFTQKEIFKASIQAGMNKGFQLTDSNSELGFIAFKKNVGKGIRNLGVNLKTVSGVVHVEITTSVTGGFIGNSQEKMGRLFYQQIHKILGITATNEKQINIKFI